jgi:hypothetical protein
MLAGPVSEQRFQSVAGRNPQGLQTRRRVNLQELPSCDRLDLGRQFAGALPHENQFRLAIAEA